MSQIQQQLKDRLKSTFKIYMCHAVEHALNAEATQNDVLQVVINLQAALELLSKLYVLQRDGWKAIVETRFHNAREPELLSALEDGSLKTTPYWKNKDIISQDIYLNEDDTDLLNAFQNRRNQIMHLGVTNPSRAILYEAIWLVVRILHQLNWQDTLDMKDQYLSNSLESLLGKDLYDTLIRKSCYVAEAVDRAYELYPDDVKLCPECGNDSWALDGDVCRTCLVCGYRGDEKTFGFIDCPSCQVKSALVYDPLNIASNPWLNGKCCACRKLIPVAMCSECGNVHGHPGTCEFCRE